MGQSTLVHILYQCYNSTKLENIVLFRTRQAGRGRDLRNKILALGNEEVTNWLRNSLRIEGIDVVRLSALPESLNLVKQEGFDLAIFESGMPDLENVCFRVAWLCRLRIIVISSDPALDKNMLFFLGVNAFIPHTTPPSELAKDIEIINIRGNQQFDSIKVLIVEDDRHIREAIRLSFRIFWPEAELYFSDEGQTGINIIKGKAIDLVILDLGLPDMSGIEVLTHIRSFSQTPIIIWSAARDQENIVKSIKAGANDYLVKPFKQIELMPRIRKYTYSNVQTR